MNKKHLIRNVWLQIITTHYSQTIKIISKNLLTKKIVKNNRY